MRPHDPRLRDLLTGLAPASSSSCPRCGRSTAALANGRGRVEICGGCGTIELHSQDGVESLRLRAGSLSLR